MEPMDQDSGSIYKDRSFWGMTLTQFLAVFNDNFYKQTVMLACVEMENKSPGWTWKNQALATIVFTLPFILFSGYFGYLADRYSKRFIIVLSKLAEVGIMLLAMVAFNLENWPLMFIVLFLLGIHSTMYAPAKYGLLPELFSESKLPKVNGLFQLSMFVAIVLGIGSAGVAAERVGNAVVTMICMAIATVGFFTSLLIRDTPAAHPHLKFDRSGVFINPETRKVIWADKRLLAGLLATSVFWATGGLVYPQAINEVGITQLQLSKEVTSYMAAGTGLGIAVGCVLGMMWSYGMFNARLVRLGALGMFLGLVALALPGPFHNTLLGAGGTGTALIWLGICAGVYNVPLQVLIQARAPEDHKGRVIGVMSLANWIGIYLSGVLLLILKPQLVRWGLPMNLLFAAGALFFLPILLFYHPKSEVLKSYIPHGEAPPATAERAAEQ